ncbi:TadE/TadG family type IV pilus assembly protein [Devosia rhizoryzae]|uniref:Pilus assembly protein n=1 Tax=Devosia rhizoryzae TaxID=2774137 RepID=A0ABX7C5J0_9HYPH|nr:TadE/TadG family type IV pilus assembly protein [Devosia rhizoryzae]QQR39528.1 pilus assembly protein [Devosia rhizoryzae]
MSMMPRTFRHDQQGASIIEFALMAPILLALLLGAVTLFDLFRNLQSVEKATFTVGDMMSRELAMDQTKLASMLTLVKKMVPTASDGGLRVSSVTKTGGNLHVNWSKPVGSSIPTTPVSTANLPAIAEGDTVLITESFVPHRAFVDTFGLDAVVFSASAVHRPRFVNSMSFPN